jgi:hypothetical protein
MATLNRTTASRQAIRGERILKPQTESPASAELRPIFAGQARLLAERSERGLPIDVRSLSNLAFAYLEITEAERDDGDVTP